MLAAVVEGRAGDGLGVESLRAFEEIVHRSSSSVSGLHPLRPSGLLGVPEGLKLVHVFLLIDRVVGEDQRLADGAQGIFDPIEIVSSPAIVARGADHSWGELIGDAFDGLSDGLGLVEGGGGIHGTAACTASLCQERAAGVDPTKLASRAYIHLL